MLTNTSSGATFGPAIKPNVLAAGIVAVAVLCSSIVFSEPAIADAMMIAVIGALPVLGVARYGRAALINVAMWLALVALGLAGTMLSTNFDTAFKHQLITLFLAVGAFVLAGYVTADPEPRSRLILACYVGACLVATLAAFVGYFRIVPSTYELFTNYDRARGTFKDPNVYGAALGPAIVTLLWLMLRASARSAMLASALMVPLVIGLLISFSRGAWISTAVSSLILIAVALLRSRRRTDFQRFGLVGAVSVAGLMLALGIATQLPQVRELLEQRANLDQSYDQGPDGRFGGQEKARRLIIDNPFGIGTHTFRDTYHHEEPHNVYLSMFLNAGWIGGLLFIISIVMTLSIGLQSAILNTTLQGPATIAFASFAGLAFESYVIDTDHWRHLFILAALVWGIADAQKLSPDSSRRLTD